MVRADTYSKYKEQSEDIAKQTGVAPEVVRMVLTEVEERIKNSRRKPREPIPEGGICGRAAARKYKISQSLISYWCRTGKLKILKITPNWTYIDENSLIQHLSSKPEINTDQIKR